MTRPKRFRCLRCHAGPEWIDKARCLRCGAGREWLEEVKE